MAAIKRRRGNTRKDLFIVQSETTKLPIDIAGCTFEMFVTTDKAPDTRVLGTNLLYSLTGTPDANPLTGKVTFTPSALDATQVDGTYYYEVIMTDSAGLTETVALDKYVYF